MKRELIYRVLQAGGSDFIQNLSAIMSRSGVIYTICEIIQRDYYRNLTVQELAKQAGMSVSLFIKLLRKLPTILHYSTSKLLGYIRHVI